MHTKTLALAASLMLPLTGVSLAQTAAGGGSTEGNMKNPGSVKSSGEKAMEQSTGSKSIGPTDAVGATTVPGDGSSAGSGTVAPTSGHSGGANTSSGNTAR